MAMLTSGLARRNTTPLPLSVLKKPPNYLIDTLCCSERAEVIPIHHELTSVCTDFHVSPSDCHVKPKCWMTSLCHYKKTRSLKVDRIQLRVQFMLSRSFFGGQKCSQAIHPLVDETFQSASVAKNAKRIGTKHIFFASHYSSKSLQIYSDERE